MRELLFIDIELQSHRFFIISDWNHRFSTVGIRHSSTLFLLRSYFLICHINVPIINIFLLIRLLKSPRSHHYRHYYRHHSLFILRIINSLWHHNDKRKEILSDFCSPMYFIQAKEYKRVPIASSSSFFVIIQASLFSFYYFQDYSTLCYF
jgi:hypothetical protein